MTRYGYARVSTRDQSTDHQVDALRAAGVAVEDLFVEKVSGKLSSRPQLDALLANPALLSPDIDFGTLIDLPGTTGAQYRVFLMDEDDADRGADQTDLSGDADATNDEDNVDTTDNNRSIVLLATGYAQDETEVRMEAIVSPLPLPRWKTQTHVLGSGGMCLIKGSRQQDAAWTTLKFTVREDMIVTFALGTVPARRSLGYSLPIPAGGPPAHYKLYADVQSIAFRAGVALVIARRDQTRIADAAEVVRELADSGVRVVGTVMNGH